MSSMSVPDQPERDANGNALYAPDPWAAAFADDEPARPYKVDKATLWNAARLDYAAGHTAETICAAYDLNLSTFRQRARREGWRRSDLAEDGGEVERIPELEPAPPTAEMIEQAWRWVADALARGKPYEARTWMRLHKELKAALATAEHQAHWRTLKAELEPDLHPLHPDDAADAPAAETVAAPRPGPLAEARFEIEAVEALAIRSGDAEDARRAKRLRKCLAQLEAASRRLTG